LFFVIVFIFEAFYYLVGFTENKIKI